ncbi:MAG: polyhydroxyalkanoate synthesis regulator DNA-binding domain-containing protein [candidate division KSB1 bacterium]|nr:polyhydroxyalkanoate synthesis regulator DNA-binding domain-containing protein [candidate division KSB1 bacterium]MDZ7364789.1 polyhydroxyalkanoate synthesis regulator DNA-binding domain-containing protein [candidate division KSB1 bacterium]MDZ7402892.1 polyhydroxyalkanoate synthesis regulator DNA-binding domain-containing protein [candidate division KSB1 bacterium]
MSRTIKRYENRKLYDTEDRRYVSLEDIALLVRRGIDVQVVDNATGDDITTQTLTQVIFEEGKRGRNPLSKDVLHEVIRFGNTLIDGGIQQVRHGLNLLMPNSFNKLFNATSAADAENLKQLREKVESLEAIIKSLVNEKFADDSKTNK